MDGERKKWGDRKKKKWRGIRDEKAKKRSSEDKGRG